MTVVIHTNDDRSYAGADAERAVEAMKNAGIFTAGETLMEYMKGYSQRALTMNGWTVRHDTADHLLDDLVRCGEVTLSQGH